MKLAIADPPYLGRAVRWYGEGGRASGGGLHRADVHPDAAEWDDPETHRALVRRLEGDFDGWALAASPDSLPLYLAEAPAVRVMVWHKRNAVPSGSRIRACWEPVLISTPRTSRAFGVPVNDVLDAPAPGGGFAGAKPAAWTRWVLAALGYDPETDEVADLFAGSGSVTAELRQGVFRI